MNVLVILAYAKSFRILRIFHPMNSHKVIRVLKQGISCQTRKISHSHLFAYCFELLIYLSSPRRRGSSR